MMLQLRPAIVQKLSLSLAQLHLSTIGDTPLFSLHRINTVWKKSPPSISNELARVFTRNLFEQNKMFQKKTGKKWNCVTLDGFRFATTDTEDMLQDMISKHSHGMNIDKAELENMKKAQIDQITLWFETNYEGIIYSIGSKLPWAFILYLKERLTAWRNGLEFAFDQSMSDIKDKFNINLDE
jgi:hypothetical protein